MQCFNCQFENLPGMARCVRCDSVLTLGEVAVLPPRATRWRLLSTALRIGHAFASLADRAWLKRPQWNGMLRTKVAWQAVAWSLIPGFGLIKHGARPWGVGLLVAWAFFMLMSLLALGLPASAVLLNLAILVHLTSALWFLGGELNHHGRFVVTAFALLGFGALRYALYEPVLWTATRFYDTVSLENLAPGQLIQNGDGLLYEGPWLRPDRYDRGDLVFYEIPDVAHGQLVMRPGFGLDRIVGVPRDRVKIVHGVLLVNETPVPAEDLPLAPELLPADLGEIVLHDGEFLIIPSRLDLKVHGQVPVEYFRRLIYTVRMDNIRGRVVYCLHPWSRFGRLE